jgi:hypothetical protein
MHVTLTLCITISWSREGVVFFVLGHLAMSFLLPCPESTDAHCPFLGVLGPYPQSGVPFPRIHAHSLPMVQNITNVYLFFGAQLQTFTNPLQSTAWTTIQDIVLKKLVFLHHGTIKTRTNPEALCNVLVLCFTSVCIFMWRGVCATVPDPLYIQAWVLYMYRSRYCSTSICICTGVCAAVPACVCTGVIYAVPVPVYIQVCVLLYLYLNMYRHVCCSTCNCICTGVCAAVPAYVYVCCCTFPCIYTCTGVCALCSVLVFISACAVGPVPAYVQACVI